MLNQYPKMALLYRIIGPLYSQIHLKRIWYFSRTDLKNEYLHFNFSHAAVLCARLGIKIQKFILPNFYDPIL